MGLFGACLSFVYTLCGTAAFVVFLILRYYAAAVFGFATASLSGVTAHINWLHMKNRLSVWYEHDELQQLFRFGFVIFAIAASCFTYYIVAITQGIAVTMDVIVSIIWTIILLKSGGVLMYYTNKYWMEQNRGALLTENTGNGEQSGA